MELFSDVVLLSRVQFAATIAYHFIFVPLSIGLGLILAITETHFYRTRNPKDAAASKLWVKIFTATFAIGVATGITMEFAFGTNWANYSRFVGDIFGAPLAAEGLFAFFLESVFLGVLLFGRTRVSPKFYMVSAWLVWFGSCLSALWILIANSWMQTPGGAELSTDGTRAIITDFWAAALNPTIFSTYTHTVTALLIMGAFAAMAISAWYMLKHKNEHFAMMTMRIGAVVGIIGACAILLFGHMSAVDVLHEQPTKLAMMEGLYENDVPNLAPGGWVDQENHQTYTPIAIPGGTSFLAFGNFDTEVPGLVELSQQAKYSDMVVDDLPVNFVFQVYHIMICMFGLIFIIALLAVIFSFRKKGQIKHMRWLQWILVFAPICPFLAIQTGWCTAEVGRQPWVVYPATSAPDGVSLLTLDGVSQSVSAPELLITLSLFLVVYMLLLIGWIRVIGHFIGEGPQEDDEPNPVSGMLGKGTLTGDADLEPAAAKGGK